MPNLVVSAVAKWNGTALKKGERQLTQFQKTTNNLAKSFAAAMFVVSRNTSSTAALTGLSCIGRFCSRPLEPRP